MNLFVGSRRPTLSTAAALLVAVGLIGSALAQDDRSLDRTNPLLGPRYSRWMVGAIGEIATEEERQQFLRLGDDEAAGEFADTFWEGRETTRVIYEQRAEEADRRFGEGVTAGRRSDRGAVYILYGEPEDTSYEENRNVEDPPVELWEYPKKREPGLSGKKPERRYRFTLIDYRIRLFRKGGPNDPDVRRQRALRRRAF